MKKGKGKAAKKAMKFADRKAKADKWMAEYDGTAYGGDIIKAYRKKFAVDRMKAVEQAAVRAYQDIQRAKKAKRKRIREQKRMQKDIPIFHEDQDNTFYYIAGYTSDGAPYGVTWKEMGMLPGTEEFDD